MLQKAEIALVDTGLSGTKRANVPSSATSSGSKGKAKTALRSKVASPKLKKDEAIEVY